jgi:hypothetical protein
MTKCILKSPKKHNRGKTQWTIKILYKTGTILIVTQKGGSLEFRGCGNGCLKAIFSNVILIMEELQKPRETCHPKHIWNTTFRLIILGKLDGPGYTTNVHIFILGSCNVQSFMNF